MREREHPGRAAARPPLQWPELENFSLVLGGPRYQLFRRIHLEDRVEDHLLRRVLVISGLIWLPLALLCLIDGTLFGNVAIPFIRDVETHVRFLVTVPMLIVAELLVHLQQARVSSIAVSIAIMSCLF